MLNEVDCVDKMRPIAHLLDLGGQVQLVEARVLSGGQAVVDLGHRVLVYI